MKKQLWFAVAVGFSFQCFPAFARRTILKGEGLVEIRYASKLLNRDSKKIDSALGFVRDTHSKKVALVHLEETEPDSGIFSGHFSLSFTNGNTEPEVYLPPPGIKQDEHSIQKFSNLIQSGEVERRPVVMKNSKTGQSRLEVFDSREAALAALEAYKSQAKNDVPGIKPVVPKQSIETAEMAERKQLMKRLNAEAAARDSDRGQSEKAERARIEGSVAEFESLSAAEQAKRKAKAAALSAQAIELYKQDQYQDAKTLLEQAMALDPTDRDTNYYYGLILYRLENFDDALVQIRISMDSKYRKNEKSYYLGLIHYRLREIELALAKLHEVKASQDADLSPSASFYEGIILMGLDRNEEAKAAFEYTIDHSNDPKLDEQAEKYIEQILQGNSEKAAKGHKLAVSASLGLMYDSNILLAPDYVLTQGSATNKGGARMLATGAADYRYYSVGSHDLNVRSNLLYLYSLQSSFAAADPMIGSIALPYAYKNQVWGKGYKLSLSPTFEMLYMDPYSTGTRSNILNSGYLTIDNMFVMKPTWFSNYSFQIRRDISTLANSVGDNDFTSWKYTLSTNQYWFLDPQRKSAFIGNLGAILNQARGINRSFYRFDAGLTFTSPLPKWKASWLAGLAVYYLSFSQATPRRHDTDVAVTLGLQKPIRDWVSWGLLGTYTANGSDQSNFQYSKYVVMSTLTLSTGMF